MEIHRSYDHKRRKFTILGALVRKGKMHSRSGTPEAILFSFHSLTWSSSNNFPSAIFAPWSLLNSAQVPRFEIANRSWPLHLRSRSEFSSRVSWRKDEDEHEGSPCWTTTVGGATEGRRRLPRSGIENSEEVWSRA